MTNPRNRHFLGYVKVELQSASPRRWVWSVRRDSSDLVVFSSAAPFAPAEDAWAAGRKTLTALEDGSLADPRQVPAEVD